MSTGFEMHFWVINMLLILQILHITREEKKKGIEKERNNQKNKI